MNPTNWDGVVDVAPAATFLVLLSPNGGLPSPCWSPVACLRATGRRGQPE